MSEQLPSFGVGVRGYDRRQVDDYVRDLLARFEQTQARATVAEGELARVGARLDEPTLPLDPAQAEAVARASGADRLAAFGEQVAGILREAYKAAEEIQAGALRTAEQAREGALDAARAELAGLREQVRELIARRDGAWQQLEQLRTALGLDHARPEPVA